MKMNIYLDEAGTWRLVSIDKKVDIKILDVLTDTDVFNNNTDQTVFKVGHDVLQAPNTTDADAWTTQLRNAHQENIISACRSRIDTISRKPGTLAGTVVKTILRAKTGRNSKYGVGTTQHCEKYVACCQ